MDKGFWWDVPWGEAAAAGGKGDGVAWLVGNRSTITCRRAEGLKED